MTDDYVRQGLATREHPLENHAASRFKSEKDVLVACRLWYLGSENSDLQCIVDLLKLGL
jgi:hypothetical protein